MAVGVREVKYGVCVCDCVRCNVRVRETGLFSLLFQRAGCYMQGMGREGNICWQKFCRVQKPPVTRPMIDGSGGTLKSTVHEHVQAVPSERNHTETPLSTHLEVSSLRGMTALTIILSKTPRRKTLRANDTMHRDKNDWRPSISSTFGC